LWPIRALAGAGRREGLALAGEAFVVEAAL
jgi:hypothetical protein